MKGDARGVAGCRRVDEHEVSPEPDQAEADQDVEGRGHRPRPVVLLVPAQPVVPAITHAVGGPVGLLGEQLPPARRLQVAANDRRELLEDEQRQLARLVGAREGLVGEGVVGVDDGPTLGPKLKTQAESRVIPVPFAVAIAAPPLGVLLRELIDAQDGDSMSCLRVRIRAPPTAAGRVGGASTSAPDRAVPKGADTSSASRSRRTSSSDWVC